MDLVAFLLARIAEDERAARAAVDECGGDEWIGTVESGNPWRYSAGQGVYVWSETGPEMDRVIVGAVGGGASQSHIARHDPARVLADVEVKRRVVELHGDNGYGVCECCMDTEPLAAGDCGGADFPCDTIKLLALPYADHPDYRAEWKP